ncbi:2'-5' RNA ligase family protein [Mucilaginibacter sp. 14171R-50]|uniref:2'-5' RNA ligase family protein n=1 Tax=Mucilaginibacter sp. 14171R-50 TaxID=2703789 RepID=UPI00138D1606|nr:2'-5' RNA ligase family protein [Mucilaginibacter sp. 14171R-50]QHS57061.1 2'-5' RNA ligase family protein [Mucilaginibacter sp. 14171R-50]
MNSYIDYLFLLSPPQIIKELIGKYKMASVKHIGSYKSMGSPAHISIMHAERQKPFYASTTIAKVEARLNSMPPVLLHIDGFKYFTHIHDQYTIYAHIRITPAVDTWFALIKRHLEVKKGLIPHITVVRNIPASDFNTLWPHFRHKRVVEPFWIDELKIVTRETFGGMAGWQPFKTVQFKGANLLLPKDDVTSRTQVKLF